jgi:hypothetical protein
MTSSDAVTRTVTLLRSATSSWTTSDAVTGSRLFIRSTADALTSSDLATRVATLLRSTADAMTRSDTATRIAAYSRTAADSLTTSDAITTLRTYARTATDALTTSDTATRLGTFLRSVSEALTGSDVATRIASALPLEHGQRNDCGRCATRHALRTHYGRRHDLQRHGNAQRDAGTVLRRQWVTVDVTTLVKTRPHIPGTVTLDDILANTVVLAYGPDATVTQSGSTEGSATLSTEDGSVTLAVAGIGSVELS